MTTTVHADGSIEVRAADPRDELITELVAALQRIVKFADTEPDGGETVAVHRANIERARAALAKVQAPHKEVA